MQSKSIFVWSALAAFLVAGCVMGENAGVGRASDGDSDSDSDSDTDTDTGSDTGTDTGSDTGTDTGTDTGSDTDTGTGSDTDTDTGTGSDTDTGTGPDTDTDTGPDTDTATATDTSIDTCQLSAIAAAWTADGEGWSYSGNWMWQSSGGSPGGFMRFDDEASHLSGYSQALTSPVANLSGCGSVTLHYSIMLDDYIDSYYGSVEEMRAQCSGDGASWTTLLTYTDGDDYYDESFGWTAAAPALPGGCLGATSYIRFLSTGDDSWYFDYWGIDSVSLTP
jgi:hypothetical protein